MSSCAAVNMQAAAAALEKGRMMEVGSAAGYYTSKSPQMILHEWCRRQNRPKPRYKVLPDEDGRFRCKVGGAPTGHDAVGHVVKETTAAHLSLRDKWLGGTRHG